MIKAILSKIVFLLSLKQEEFSGSIKNRSDSDNGSYLSAVSKINRNYKHFAGFKKNATYRQILEHVSFQQGVDYIEIIEKQNNLVFKNIGKLSLNDLVGNPDLFDFKFGKFSPTSLRYGKVASDLEEIFGANFGKNLVEIGVGYGGQALLLDQFYDIDKYLLVDLQEVLNLASKYLDHHLLNLAYDTKTINRIEKEDTWDLAISNYAFSELPKNLQLLFVEKVLKNSKRGYLTMNSGNSETGRDFNKLSLSELREVLPDFEVVEEKPPTYDGNYIIVWGHK